MPESQGFGIGRMLMVSAEEAATRAGYSSMHLTVDRENDVAIHFYEQMGWTADEASSTSLSMRKSLKRISTADG